MSSALMAHATVEHSATMCTGCCPGFAQVFSGRLEASFARPLTGWGALIVLAGVELAPPRGRERTHALFMTVIVARLYCPGSRAQRLPFSARFPPQSHPTR